jgi:Peptidase family S41
MRMSSLLVVPVAMVLVVPTAQARPSAPADAAADVRELAASIESIHPEPFRSVSKARFTAAVDALARQAPVLSRDQLLVGLLRVIALLGPRNGHTGLFPLDPEHRRELHLYPLRLYAFADGIFVVDEERGLGVRGSRVTAVAGVPVETVLAQVEPLVSRDNVSNLRGLAPHYLLVAEVLDGLGVTDGPGPAGFTFEQPDGTLVTRTLTPVPGSAYASAFHDALYGHYPSILPRAARPLYLAGSGRTLWARTLAGGRAAYVGYNAVVPPAPAMVRRLTRLVAGRAVRRVIVDVRLNGGGDNSTYGPLTSLFGSPRVDRRGRLYVLIGRATFSAAANFAAELDRDTRAIFVGEPTGGGVETYGDATSVLLPATGWNVRIAARYHSRARGPNDRRLAVGPDLAVPVTSTEYFAGRDPVLERALRGL